MACVDCEHDQCADIYDLEALQRKLDAMPDLQTAVNSLAMAAARNAGVEWVKLDHMTQYRLREGARETLTEAGIADEERLKQIDKDIEAPVIDSTNAAEYVDMYKKAGLIK